MNDLVFLQRMYDAGAAQCFDVLSVNDYMLWSGPTDRRMRPLNINFSRPRYIRDIMVVNGDAHKPVWVGEMSANAVPNDANIAGLGAYGQFTLEEQARYTPLAYQRIREEWPWVGVVNFWFFKRADERERNQAMYYFRMVEPDFTPMPVYGAMKEYAAGVSSALYPGVYQESHPALTLEGQWETVQSTDAFLGAYASATNPGAALRVAFEGAVLSLEPGPGQGQVDAAVDGQPVRRISLDGQPVNLVRGWRWRAHRVELRLISGEISVDQLVVRRPWWPSRRLVLSVVGSGLFIAWLSSCVLRRR
jgi:hypothetical protein